MSDGLQLPTGQRFELADGLVIGRSPDADVSLSEDSLSRSHARVVGRPGSWILQDLHSRNGSWVNHTKLQTGGAHPVRHGDVIRLGRVLLTVQLEGSAVSTDTTTLDGLDLAKRLPLSPYQLEVLRLLCSTPEADEPPTNAQIASLLGTPAAEDAVKAALSRIYARADLTAPMPGKRRELRRRALQQGWLS